MIIVIILLSIILVISIITLCFVICVFNIYKNKNSVMDITTAYKKQVNTSESGVVFCKNCGNQYDSMNTVCPHCKTPH